MAPRGDWRGGHTNVYLTNHWVKYFNSGFIADLIAPRAPVTKDSDKYPVWDNEHFRHHKTIRADKAESSKFSQSYSDSTYQTEFYALHGDVSEAERQNADSPVAPEFDLIESIGDLIALDREKRVATLAAANVGGTTTVAAGQEWDTTSAAADPKTHIKTAKLAVFARTRMKPNAFILPYEDALMLALNVNLRKEIDSSGGFLTDAGLPARLQGLWVIEAGAGENTAKRGGGDSFSSVWTSGTSYVAYVAGLPDPMTDGSIIGGRPPMLGSPMRQIGMNKATWLRTFDLQGRVVRQWDEPARRNVDVFEVEEAVDEVAVSSNLCQKISGYTSS